MQAWKGVIMPLSKDKQAKWMREYRAGKKVLGITARKTRGYANSVIPNELTDTPEVTDTPTEIEYVDAEGYPVYRE